MSRNASQAVHLGFAIAIVVAIAGCEAGPNAVRQTADGRIVPVDYANSALSEVGQDHATWPLRYDVIYVQDPMPGVRDYVYYYRFWPNGRAEVGYCKDASEITLERAEMLPGVCGGRFLVTGRQFKMELLFLSEHITIPLRPHYTYGGVGVGEVQADGTLVMDEKTPPGEVFPKQFKVIYRPTYVGDLVQTPFVSQF